MELLREKGLRGRRGVVVDVYVEAFGDGRGEAAVGGGVGGGGGGCDQGFAVGVEATGEWGSAHRRRRGMSRTCVGNGLPSQPASGEG